MTTMRRGGKARTISFHRPIVGIADTGSDYNACHANVPRLVEAENWNSSRPRDSRTPVPAGPGTVRSSELSEPSGV